MATVYNLCIFFHMNYDLTGCVSLRHHKKPLSDMGICWERERERERESLYENVYDDGISSYQRFQQRLQRISNFWWLEDVQVYIMILRSAIYKCVSLNLLKQYRSSFHPISWCPPTEGMSRQSPAGIYWVKHRIRLSLEICRPPSTQFLPLDWLVDYLQFYVLLKNISLIWRRRHCRWRAANFRPTLGAQGLWAGWDLDRATNEARYVTTRRYVTNCYIPYSEWRRYVKIFFVT
jgi:hypothetical protein